MEKIILWNRSPQKLEPLITSLQETGREVSLASALDSAVRQADIITSATSALTPLIEGRWVQPGTHDYGNAALRIIVFRRRL
ncbi:hypothetical protein [Pantoea sp. A4]|uniref:hypothetical protein n=1 Tax=Pantoea sp. A4 TaxID=1225184 RepID=UPI0009FB4673